jgi:glycosyltransferase involved in cell wall biosynthesis
VSYEGFNLETSAVYPTEKTDRVIHLSSLESYKRTSTVLAFWKRLQTIESDIPRLKLIGPLLDCDRKAAEELAGVEHCGRLPRSELEAEIASARALLFFSEIEGFGLPALEAYLLGTPALYVKGTAVEEILGCDSPGGFSLTSFDSFRAALDEVLNIGADTIAFKAQQLGRRFAWSECAERTLAVYRSLM